MSRKKKVHTVESIKKEKEDADKAESLRWPDVGGVDPVAYEQGPGRERSGYFEEGSDDYS